MTHPEKYSGSLVEYLEAGKLRLGLALREQGERIALLDSAGQEKSVNRELVLLRYHEPRASVQDFARVAAALEEERGRLSAELDLHLLWEVVREQGGSFGAAELAELFFGKRSSLATAVVLEALFNDRLYFARRHLEFVPQSAEQVERLRSQQERSRQRSEGFRLAQATMRAVINEQTLPPPGESAGLIEDLRRYLENPHTRSKDMNAMLNSIAPDVPNAELAYEILERLGAAPSVPRFAMVGGLHSEFAAAALEEAQRAIPGPRAAAAAEPSITIDDRDTQEVDDALSCRMLPSGEMLVRTHIALVADFVAKGGALDAEAANRAATVYLPEATVRMLPDVISCDRASLTAGVPRPVLTTEMRLSAEGEILDCTLYPASLRVSARLDYQQTDRMLESTEGGEPEIVALVAQLNAMAVKLRERRRRAGAALFQRRETKVRVRGENIEIEVIEGRSPSRLMVGEYMVLSNYVAARYAAERRLPIIYRVQPNSGGDLLAQRPRLSLYPEFHAGIGLDYYAQVSSPIRRYADLVLQRQLVGALAGAPSSYATDELLKVLANAENAEFEAKELERRAKRYWVLRYLKTIDATSPLRALPIREGASAELLDYGVRGTLRGAPGRLAEVPIRVRITRADPLRGWLVMDYVGPAPAEHQPSA